MRRALPAVISALAPIAALGVYLGTGDELVPLALCLLGVVMWAWTPGALGPVEKLRHIDGRIDPAAVKDYRRRHRGTTIADAAWELDRGRR